MIEGYIEERSYESKGYQLHSEEFLTCANCQKKLVSLLIVKTDCPVFTTKNGDVDTVKFLANCPSCKEKSFVKSFHRVKLYIKAIEPFHMDDSILLEDGSRCEIKLK
jgi:hypothetical protein